MIFFDKNGLLYIQNGVKNYFSVREVYWDKKTVFKLPAN